MLDNHDVTIRIVTMKPKQLDGGHCPVFLPLPFMNVLASMIYSIHLGSVSLVSGSFKTLELPSSVDGFGYSIAYRMVFVVCVKKSRVLPRYLNFILYNK